MLDSVIHSCLGGAEEETDDLRTDFIVWGKGPETYRVRVFWCSKCKTLFVCHGLVSDKQTYTVTPIRNF
jgi:hypothetical protein